MRPFKSPSQRVLALLCTLCIVGQPLAAGAQEYGYQVPLTGMNQTITQGQLTVTPASYSFGTLVLGSTAATTAVVRNSGQDAVAITGFSVPAPFTQTNSCPSTLVGGASCNVTVTYNPKSAGSSTASLAIATSEPLAQGSFGVNGVAVVPTTNLAMSLSTVDFGDADVGSPATGKTLTITNKGNSPATVNGVGITGTEFNQSNNCGGPIAPGATCTVSLVFVPDAYGSRSGNLSLFEQASGTLYSVALTGSGNAAVMSVSPTGLNLGSAIVNYANTTAQVTVSNVGNKDITGLSLSTSQADYTVSAKTCSATLAPNTSCTATVRFAPTAAGSRSATFDAFTGNAGSASVGLSGTGTPQAPSAAASVASLAFGSIPVDGSATAQQVTFNNTGNVTLNLGGVSVVTGGTHYSRTTTCAATLAVGASCTASVTFSPRAEGATPGTLRATFSSGNVDVALTGTGTLGEASVSPATLSFSDQQVASTSVAKVVTVTNSGNRKLTFAGVSVISGASSFAQSNNCATVNPAATCTISVTFTPAAAGSQQGTLALVHDGVNGTTTVDLSGSGRSQAAALTTPAFSSTPVAASSTAIATLTNTGIGALTVTPPAAGAVTGTGYSFVSTTCGASVAPGATCTTTIRFSPSTTAPANGTLSISTGAGVQSASFGSTGIQGFATVTPSSLSYAAQQIGSTSAVKVVTVTNSGTDALTFTGVGISSGTADFAQSNDCGSVAVGGTCTVNVTFTPSLDSNRSGTLSFTHNGGGIANVSLAGFGQPASATLSDVNFGGVSVGSTPTLTSTLTNTGIGVLTMTPPASGSVSSAHFSFVSTTCGSSLAVGASCSTTVRFSPASGGAKSGTLAISTNAGLLNAALSGTGNQAVLSFSYPAGLTLDWQSRQIGGVYGSGQATLTNSGNVAATGLALTPSTPWSFYSNTCTTTLNAGQSCTFYVNFSPAAAQSYSGTIKATAPGSVVANQLATIGTGVVQTATLSTPSFPPTALGSSSTGVATLTNTGIGPLSVVVPTSTMTSGAPYMFDSTTCTSSLAVGTSCTVTVRFSPTSTGAANGLMAIQTGAGQKEASLGSTGIQGFASVSPSSLNFPTRQIFVTAPVQTVTVTNTGTNTLTFTGVGISTGSADYAQTNNCGSVAVGGTCTVNVAFTPSTTGARPGTLSFTHNGGGIANVSLTGDGQYPSGSLSMGAFPATAAGSSSTAVATLTNTGIGPLAIGTSDSNSVTGNPAFSFVSSTCLGTAIPVGGSCETTIRFTPAGPGTVTGDFAIGDYVMLRHAALTGTGNQAVLTFSYPGGNAVAWGNQQAGGVYGSGTATLTNSGNVAATGLAVVPSSTWSLYGNTCTATLNAGASCTFSMYFSPAAAQAYTGTISATAPGSSVTNQLTTSGTGVAQSAYLASPSFPATPVGGTSTAVVTLSNTGLGPLSVSVPIWTATSGPPFTFVSTDCTPSLAVGASCGTTVRYSPTAAGASTGLIAIVTGAGQKEASLGSTGIQGYASVNPSGLAYVDRQVASTSAAQVITVTNTGTNVLTFTGVGISAGASDFAQSNNCGSVAIGGTCTVNVAFTPSTTGSRAGTLSFTHNGGGVANVSLTGTGRAASATLSAPAIPATSVGGSNTADATLTNTGIGNLSVTVPTASSVTGTDFSFVATNCTAVLAPGGSCVTTVRFSPTANTLRSGSLAIATGAGTQSAGFSSTGNQAVLTLSYPAGSSVNWGYRQIGDTYGSGQATLTNSGNIPASGLTLTPSASWSFYSNTCTATLGAGQSCTFYMYFSPTAAQAYSGTVTVASPGSLVTNQLTTTGTGVVQTATLSTPSFAPTAVGSSSTGVATLTNTGVGPLAITVPTWTMTSGAPYMFDSTTCTSSLAVSTSCTVTVRFSPTSTGAVNGLMAIQTGAGQKEATLGSTGIQGYASVNPASISFGTYGRWTTSPAQTITVTNTGSNTLTFTGVGILDGTADFAQSNNCGAVAVGGTCSVNVTFSPSAGGARTGTLSFTHNGGGIANVSLSGTGNHPYASLSMGAFPTTAVGSSSTAVATLTNSSPYGPMPVGSPVMSGSTAFSLVSTTCNTWIPASSSCTSTVRFSPTSTATQTGNFAINDWNQWHNAPLSATGIQAAVSLSAASIAFPNETANRSSSTLSMTLTNSGNTTLTINNMYMSSSVTEFTVTSTNCVGQMGPGGTCTVSIRFAPTSAGFKGGTVAFANNGAGPSSFNVTGTGYDPAVITSRSFSPTTITAGNNSTYSWATSNATSVNVTCSGAVSTIGGSTTALSGSVTVRGNSPGTGSCFIAAYNVLGTGTGDSIDMNVVAAPTVATASFSPSTVMAGNATTFSWSTSNATSASVSCGYPASGSGSGLSGSITVTTAAAGTGYCTTTAYNAAGNSGSYQANLSVTPAYTYGWQTGGWSTPAACGATTATRSVWCQRSDGATVGDASCGGGKPATTTGTSDYSACSYNFSYGGWSTPAGCGYVTQSRSATCYRSDGAVVGNGSCGTPVTTQGANDYSACSYSFEYGGWSTPAGCGAVTQTRSAQCRRSDGAIVSNGYCGSPVTTQGGADYSACSYSANVGGWSGCSNSCGTGTQSRSVSCQRSDGAYVANSSCGSPATSQSCTDNSGCAPPPAPPVEYYVQMVQPNQEEVFDYVCTGYSYASGPYPDFYSETSLGGCYSGSYYYCNQDFNAKYNSMAAQCRSIMTQARGF